MAELRIHYPDDLLKESGKPHKAVEQELQLDLAVRLFEMGKLSIGKAAELAGMSKPRFADELGRRKIPVINLDDDEIQAELRAIRSVDHR
jgi:predicted HTH domain antitoxin